MNDAKRKEAIEQTIYEIGGYIAKLKRFRKGLAKSDRGYYAVDIQGILFHADDGGSATSDPYRAARYHFDEAKAIAPKVRNGNGTRGNAVHLDIWCSQMIKRQTELLVTLETAYNQI